MLATTGDATKFREGTSTKFTDIILGPELKRAGHGLSRGKHASRGARGTRGAADET